jgi:O-antigen ligase
MAAKNKVSLKFYLLIAYVALLFFEPQQFYPMLKSMRITYCLGITLIILAIIGSKRVHKINILGSPLFKLCSLFFGLVILSCLFSNYEYVDNVYVEVLKVYALVFIVGMILSNKREIYYFSWIIIIFGVINAGVTIYYYHHGYLPTRMPSYFGSMGQSGSNEFSLLMTMLLCFAIIFYNNVTDKYEKIFLIFSMLNFIYCITRTRSRGGFIGLCAIIIAMIILKYANKKMLLIVSFALLILIIKTPGTYFDRINTIFGENTYEEDTNVTSRFDTYEYAFNVVGENIMLGIGTNQFIPHIRERYKKVDKIYAVHNTLFSVASENGLPAAIVYFVMIIQIIREVRAIEKVNKNLSAKMLAPLIAIKIAIIGFLFVSMTLSVQYNRLVMILIGMVISSSAIITRNRAETKNIEETNGKNCIEK